MRSIVVVVYPISNRINFNGFKLNSNPHQTQLIFDEKSMDQFY